MRIAVVGSRNLCFYEFEKFFPNEEYEIISGGARGIDSCVKEYAKKNDIIFTEILPQYNIYGRAAPIIRNRIIADLSDLVFAFWDGKSKGTKNVIDYCRKTNKKVKIIYL